MLSLPSETILSAEYREFRSSAQEVENVESASVPHGSRSVSATPTPAEREGGRIKDAVSE
jgi:hypothetical protein